MAEDPSHPKEKFDADLLSALERSPAAKVAWDALTPLSRRDFMSWINEAKRPETRAKRLGRACENLITGKRRPCCYAVVPMDVYKALGADPTAKATWSAMDSNKRRDLTDWIEASPDKLTRKSRIVELCQSLVC